MHQRRRSPNFSIPEKLKLLEIISKYKHVFESTVYQSQSDAAKQQAQAWIEISKIYNSEKWTSRRTMRQLKLCYDNIRTIGKTVEKKPRRGKLNSVKKMVDNDTKVKVALKDDLVEVEVTDPELRPLKMEMPSFDENDNSLFYEEAMAERCSSPGIKSPVSLEPVVTLPVAKPINIGVNDILPSRRVEERTFNASHSQQELKFRQEEHELDIQIKMQKLENERQISEKIAMEMVILKLERQALVKSLKHCADFK